MRLRITPAPLTPTRQVVIQAYLHTLAFALVGTGVISLLGFCYSGQATRFDTQVLPAGAVALQLLGLLLLGSARQWRTSLRLASALLLVLVFYSLWRNGAALALNADLSPVSGLTGLRNETLVPLALLTLALFGARWGVAGRLFAWAVGVTCLGMVVLVLLAQRWPGLTLGIEPLTSPVAMLFSVLLGLASLLLTRLTPDALPGLDRRSLLGGCLGSLLTCLGWYALTQQTLESTRQQSELLLANVHLSIERSLQARLSLLQRIAERRQILGPGSSALAWTQETQGYLRDFPNIDLFAVLDADLQPQAVRSRHPAAARWLDDFLRQAGQRRWLQEVADQEAPQMSGPAVAGDQHVLLATRLKTPDGQRLLIASLNLPGMLKAQLGPDFDGFVLRVFADQQVVFDSSDGTVPSLLAVGQQRLQQPAQLPMRLVSYLPPGSRLGSAHWLPILAMLLGLGFSWLLLISQRLAGLAMERAGHLREANQALEASALRQASLQALNERIMQYSLDLICCIDEQGCFIQLSPSVLTVLGYLPDELLGQSLYERVVPQDRSRTQAHIEATLAGHTQPAIRNRCLRKDGSSVHLLWSLGWSPVDRTLFAVAHDISPLVRNESYAQDQRDILSLISTDQPLPEIFRHICAMAEALDPSARSVIMRMDKTQRQLRVGAAPSLPETFRQALDGLPIGPQACSCGTAVYRRRLVLVSDIAADPLWEALRDQALQHGLRACWAIPLIAHQGAVLGTFALYHGRPLEPDDEQLQLLGTAGQLAAIAIERELDRHRLQESEQRYRSLFTFNPDPVFSQDRQGRFESLNQAACDLAGYREDEVIGQGFELLLVDEDLSAVKAHFQAVLAGQAQRYELQARNRRGERIELDVSHLPIMVEGQIVGVFGIAKDVSERNRVHRDLRDALRHSQHRAHLLHGLSESAVSLNGRLDDPTLLEHMVEQMRLLIGAHQAVLSLSPADDSATPNAAVSFSEKYANWSQAPGMLDLGGLYELMDGPAQPLLLTEAQLLEHPRWRALALEPLRHPPLRGCLAVPLQAPAGPAVGLLQLSDKLQGEFDADDLAIALQFAQMAMAVLENHRLVRAVVSGEQRLQAQLGFTSAITDSIAEGLIASDLQGRLSFVNPAAAALIGQPASQLLGQPLDQVLPLPFDTWTVHETPLRQGEFSLPRDGQPAFLAYSGAPLQANDGAGGWVLAFRDINLQRLATQAMRERDQFFTLSLEMFCMVDLRGRFIQVNPAFISVLGYPPDCLIGQPYMELIQAEDRPLFRSALQHMQNAGMIEALESRAIDLQGQQRWLQLSAALGEDQVIYCVARDISAAKQAAHVLQDTLLELGRSNRELQEFAFVASHDLQEPLRKIQAFAERLQSTAQGLDEQQRDYLQRMSSAAGRMQSLIRDLLQYSRLSSRAQPFVPVELQQVLNEVLQDLETSLESSQARLDCGPLPAVLGDPTQLRQLLQNLLSNALKFHAPGVAPRVRIYAQADGPEHWLLCVEDQGIGFEEKYLDRIFNPFQRLHGRDAYPGTGIGLAIVKKIVERHAASITASSVPGQGTVFRIRFRALEQGPPHA
ncbi:MAG: PAS domain S-box protein [Pseudomonas sp.]|uniref:PAS domain S-box protein n=1 Tax=Pseudomonas sp. TaxID=306 RepID=UPI0033944A6F